MDPCTEAQLLWFKQYAIIAFLTAEGVTPKEIHLGMKAIDDDYVNVSIGY